MRLVSFCFSLFLPIAALADVPLGDFTRFDTRFGPVEVVEAQGAPALRIHGRDIALPQRSAITIRTAFALAEEPVDWVLVGQGGGGGACPPPVTILRVTAGDVAVSPPFGACVHTIREVALSPGRIAVHLPSPVNADLSRVFTFDGVTLTEADIPLDPAAYTALPTPAEIAAWAGTYRHLPEEPFVRAALRAYLAQRYDDLGDSAREMFDRIEAASAVRPALIRRGDWVFQTGCRARQCDQVRAIIGVRITDAAVVAALLEPNGRGASLGPDLLDPAFRQLVEEQRPD
ncbi:hypothetical protein [Roseicyclus persicicus]|uniref:Uncharacterized protein n=1 Tax=Roseicyclus persicicus TaxID=2650661 RepID=A0A7X6GXE0_9RHOB|nr:hypothetical protein [Roseibacterium persicicum]NKX44162.1 hypothetical protein [Roseibacterium persicicum]